MIKTMKHSINNTSNGVEFLLRGARKRRKMAMIAAKTLNNDMGVAPKLVAVK